MQNFLVVSYDDDQQQWFYDTVRAESAENASALICELRPYVVAARCYGRCRAGQDGEARQVSEN